MNTHQIHNMLSTQVPYFRHQDLFLPHITRPQIRAHYTKRQLFFQSDFRIPFSSMVQRVRRFFVTKRKLWVQPIMYLSSPFSSAQYSNDDDDDDDDVHFCSDWFHWLERSVPWRRLLFSKEKLNRNIETVFGRHRKVTMHNESSRHWKRKSIRKQVTF